ncbi:MAG: sodium/solute symporter [Pirellulales bacterium]|nr:sodium/solute symporter [Pirellulales bacterium]
MVLNPLDIAFFLAFFVAVVGLAVCKSRREKTSEDYFLAGRGLTWPLIGLSIVAANISTEQMVGMAGQGAGTVGLAVSAWQLTGSVGIVIIAFTFLPRFLRAGIYTMPEFLEYRYNSAARVIMALLTVVVYVVVLLTAVLYSGGLTLRTIFDVNLSWGVWGIGAVAAVYTTWGGLKAVAWADLVQGLALLAGGMLIFALGLHSVGGWEAFTETNAERLHMILPASDPTLPWTGVGGGMWIVIIYYCGLNQFIVQRNLAAKTLHHGQMGMVFAGALWLLVPFAIVMPGIMAQQAFPEALDAEADKQNARLLEKHLAAPAGQVADELVRFRPDEQWKARHGDRLAEIDAHNRRIDALAGDRGVAARDEPLVGRKYDAAFPMLIKRLLPPGLRGFLFAAIAGAVISSLASMLNSASTIFTMDVYRRLLNPRASQTNLVWLGRLMTLLFVVAACLAAPTLDDPRYGGVFQFIQQFQGYIWPGVVAAFVIALLVPRAPGAAGVVALVGGPIIYGLFQHFTPLDDAGFPAIHFLIQVLLTFLILCAAMLAITLAAPLKEPKRLPDRPEMALANSKPAATLGTLVIAGVALFVVIFW